MLTLLPMLLLAMAGYLIVSRIVLRPGISVGEAIRDSGTLLPRAIGVAI